MRNLFYILILVLLSGLLPGQPTNIYAKNFGKNGFHKDSLNDLTQDHSSKVSVLAYVRVISNSKGSVRTDQNIVTNFKVLKWLKLELGLRYGERPEQFNSYYHYKVELQTKSFWKTTRFLARISDNVITFPKPAYKKTNGLFVVETKYKLSRFFQGIAGGGYLFSSQQFNNVDAIPSSHGVQANYPVFKLALRYIVKNKGFIELVYGSYDVFNPYELNKPFFQISWEHEFSRVCSLYSYVRYEYNNNVFKPYNYFLGLGLMFHLPGN